MKRFSRSFTPLIVVMSVGCSAPEKPSPGDPARHGSAARALVEKTPVIDIHTHTFNARFLPVQGIALGKRDAHPLLSFAGDSLVTGITTWIVNVTEQERQNHPFRSEWVDPQSDFVKNCVSEANGKLRRAGASANLSSASLVGDPAISGMAKILSKARLDMQGTPLNLTEAEARRLKMVAGIFEGGTPLSLRIPFIGNLSLDEKSAIGEFFVRLTRSESQLPAYYQQDHEGKVSLFASHMMDMAPSYDQDEDESILLPFEKRQIDLVRKQQNVAGGKMLYFVAYNPFRDHWGPDAAPGKSLDIVKKAYESKGAFGVKVYPPSGYAATGTVIPSRPWSIARQPHQQWCARYCLDGRKISGAEIDTRLDELFQWTLKKDVPVFTHSGVGELEARKGYGLRFSNPAHWKALLEKPGKYGQLRLCFGHAGGESFWFDEGPNADWGETVYDLCTRYPNVYCEFGHFTDILYQEKRGAFVKKVGELIQKSRKTPGAYDFSKKILYGSDWYMPMERPGERGAHLRSFQDAIYEISRDHGLGIYEDFFFKNALEYLKAERQTNNRAIPVSLRNNLKILIRKK